MGDSDTSLLCLGDTNGRLTKLEPTIKTDANGRMIEKWTDQMDMHHLNYTEKCNGTYTFQSLNGQSAIDHVLVNNTLQEKYIGMYINEDRHMLNISDHNLVRTWFRIGPEYNNPRWKKATKKCITWINRDEDRLVKCAETFKKKIGKKHSFRKCMNKLKTSIDENLKRRKIVKLGGKGKIKLISAPWVDNELIENIKLRTKLNKEWRMARKRGEPERILKIFKEMYLKQKRITALMTGDKKSNWESRKINETWKDSKKFWVMIRELLGKKREVEEEAYVYSEGEKKEIMTCEESFTQKWTTHIYQTLKKADFTFWYGKENQEGVKSQMEKKLEQGDPDIMENPVIEEKEFINTIKNMKNGRASGVDNIPAEVMKVLTKDEETKKYLLKCFNRSLMEKVHEDWLLSN